MGFGAVMLSLWSADPPLWFQLVIVGAWLGTVGGIAEWLHRRTSVNSEIIRKVVHIGVGNVILLAWWVGIPAWLGLAASVAFSIVTFLSYYVPILPSINGVGRKSLGTFFYAISFGILIGCFWRSQPHYAAIGILVMTWGDGLAALVGQRFGRHPYKLWDMKKSWEGSLAMGIVSYAVSSLILLSVYGNDWQVYVIALFVAIVATSLEAFSKYGIDNLTVPISSALVSFGMGQFLLLESSVRTMTR